MRMGLSAALVLIGAVPQSVAQRPAGADAVWIASPVMESCDGPVVDGRAWHDPGFAPADWAAVVLPDTTGIPGDRNADRFYRTAFDARVGERIVLEWSSDDGSWVFLNGNQIAHEGGDCHQGGCVNMQCGSWMGGGGFVDLSPHLRDGGNVLGVHVTNGGCCGASFNARVHRGATLAAVAWTASDPAEDCQGPTDGTARWHEPAFDARGWKPARMPDLNPIEVGKPGDRYYRGTFAPAPGKRYILRWLSDDGIWLYANGRFLLHRGGECGQGGVSTGELDITPYISPGANLLGAHLSNGPGCCLSLFAPTLLEQDLAEAVP
jgi:hypothetical protein